VPEGAAAGLEALAQPEQMRQRAQCPQLLTQARHRRGDDRQSVGRMRTGRGVVGGDGERLRQRHLRQVAPVQALARQRLGLCAIARPQQHLVPRGGRERERRAPGTGTEDRDLHGRAPTRKLSWRW
jgi:hypothetical protein